MSSIQCFHHFTTEVDIYINNQIILFKLIPDIITDPIEIHSGINNIIIREYGSNKLLYGGKFLLQEHQQIFLIPFINNKCISVLKNQEVPDNEAVLQFINLSNTYPSLHLSVTKGDNLFENIGDMQVSEKLNIFPMIIDLEIRNDLKIIKNIPKVHFQPNNSYIILFNQHMNIYILKYK